MRQSVLGIGFAGLLSACGSLPPVYQHPQPLTAEYSKLILTNNSPMPMWTAMYQEPLTCSDSMIIADRNQLWRNNPITLYVKRGQPVTIGAMYLTDWASTGTGLSRNECSVMSTFVPSKDAYRVNFQGGSQRCAAGAVSEDAEHSPVPENEFIVRKFHIAFLQSGPWCTDLTTAQRDTLKRLTAQ
ncbi:hypothetical protein CDL60_12835 [Roseateles noduli]|nr:hypothetical protein CDL60_12835 [Roseateles noduli]